MPYLLRREPVPETLTRLDETIYKVFYALNIIVPFFEAFTAFVYNMFATTNATLKFWNIAMTTTRLCVGLLSIITAVFLGYAVLKIKSFLNNSKDGEINVRILAVHSATFSLYIISIIIYFTFYVDFALISQSHKS